MNQKVKNWLQVIKLYYPLQGFYRGIINRYTAFRRTEDTERPKVNFEVGETIKINDGPFLNFSGAIEEIEPDRGKLKVTVNIFGRNTPVELEYWQVEKA